MKITKVDIMKMDTGNHFTPICIRVYTDEGIYGDGEAALSYGASQNAAVGILKDFAAYIIGMDPLEQELVWQKLYETFWGKNGGPVIFSGISAFDIALWDIRGKFFNVPVYKLLGGQYRKELRTYASQLQYGWSGAYETMATREDYFNVAKKAVAEGFDCVKVDFLTFDRDGRTLTTEETTGLLKPYYIDLFEERLSAVREAVGPNVDIIIENHSNTDANSAVQIARMAEKYRIFAFEEPNVPTPKMTRAIRERISLPIAHGERVYSRWQFAPYFENGSVQLIQPDVGNCGGITEVKKVADMAHIYDVCVQIHSVGSPIETAAALQLECAIPNFCIHELHRVALCDFMRRLCKYDYMPVDGKFQVPDLPGIGNELSEYALTHCQKITVE